MPPVLIAGALGGLGPGLLATAASLILHLALTGAYRHLIEPGSPLFAAEWARVGIFALLGVGIAWLGERLRTTRQQAAAREAHLQSILDTVPDAMIVIDDAGHHPARSARRRSACSATARPKRSAGMSRC